MSYTHLTISERVKIETYLELDYPIRKIAKLLNRQPSTISREIKRHAGSTADEAQVRYHQNKSNCGAKSKCTPEVKEAVQEKLWDTWSPEQIVGRLYQGQLSFKTIYRWIYEGFFRSTYNRSPSKRKAPKAPRNKRKI